MAQLRAHGLAEMLDAHYQPSFPADHEELSRKQAWLYAVFQSVIKSPSGRAIVQRHKQNGDARAVLQDLQQNAHFSTAGIYRTAQLHDEIVNLRLDSTYKSQVEFLLHFADLVRLHSDCLLYTSPSPRDLSTSRMPSSA